MFLAGPRRLARGGAAADRRRPRHGRRRAPAQAPRARRRRARRGDRARGGGGGAGTPRRRTFAIAYEDEHLLVVDKPAGVVVHPARGHRAGHARAGARRAARPAATTRRAPASCTGSTATRPACSSSRAPTRCTPRSRRRCARRDLVREYLALVEGRPPARRGTIDAPLGRDRRVRTRVSTDTDEAARGDHALRGRARAAARHAAARPAGDRPHPPDPRAPARDRASGGRRPASTARPGATAWRASSCTPRGSRSRIRSAASPSTCARRCRPISPPRCTGRGGRGGPVHRR